MPRAILPFSYQLDLMRPYQRTMLSLRARASEPSASLEDLEEMVRIFASAAHGGLAGFRPEEPAQCTAEVVTLERAQPGALIARLALSGVDAAATRLLFAMVVQSHFENEPLAEVSIRCDPALQSDVGAEAVAGLPLSPRIAAPPFDLSMEPSVAESHEIVLRVTLARPPTKQEKELLQLAIDDWDSVVVLGGFLPGFAEQDENPIWPGPTNYVSRRIVEHPVHAYQAGTHALDGFVNMMVKLHAAACPIAEVEIE